MRPNRTYFEETGFEEYERVLSESVSDDPKRSEKSRFEVRVVEEEQRSDTFVQKSSSKYKYFVVDHESNRVVHEEDWAYPYENHGGSAEHARGVRVGLRQAHE